MRQWIALALLAACGSAPKVPPEVAPVSFRDLNAPIASQANFDATQFLGDWQVVAGYPVRHEAGCEAISMTFASSGADQFLVRHNCQKFDGQQVLSGSADIIAAGRFRLTYSGAPIPTAELWALWVDQGYRTAVIGSPDGQVGWILNRTSKIPEDRMNAAREILDFYGYDQTRLREIAP